MKIYADTSVLVAWFHAADVFAPAVHAWGRQQQPEFCWNAILRAELRHNLRRLTGSYAALAWQAYRASEKSRCLVLDAARPEDLLEWGDDLGARHAGTMAGTWDCVHVAAALHTRVEVFATCDAAQAALARQAGLLRIKLFS
jgi:predicted nucleic acid-binding protein